MEISDAELIDTLKERLVEKDRALDALKGLTENLEVINERLRESEGLKTHFLSNIRNEINNPLTVLVNLSEELANTENIDAEKRKAMAESLYSESLYLDFQMRNILYAADLEAGEFDLYSTKIDVNALIEKCIKNFIPLIRDESIEVCRDMPADLYINGDQDKLFLALSNLICNGIVFNETGKRLDISVREEGDSCIFAIRDEGMGIHDEHKEIIFDRFRQLDRGMRKRYRGHGLGLSVVKALCDIMGGSISLESEPDKGSTFTLSVPNMEAAEGNGFSCEGIELFGDEGGGKEF